MNDQGYLGGSNANAIRAGLTECAQNPAYNDSTEDMLTCTNGLPCRRLVAHVGVNLFNAAIAKGCFGDDQTGACDDFDSVDCSNCRANIYNRDTAFELCIGLTTSQFFPPAGCSESEGEIDDGDGLWGDCDNCPSTYNPGQEDTDEDGVGDACDNCVTVLNPEQLTEM